MLALNYYTSKHVLRRQRLVEPIHDYWLAIDLHDTGLSRDIAVRGTGEEQLKYIIDREVRPGDVDLDLRANIGCYSIMLALRVGDAGRGYRVIPVLAFLNRRPRLGVRTQRRTYGKRRGNTSLESRLRTISEAQT